MDREQAYQPKLNHGHPQQSGFQSASDKSMACLKLSKLAGCGSVCIVSRLT
jgi:hypothetical protein